VSFEIPFIIDENDIPEDKCYGPKSINKLMMFLNVSLPIAQTLAQLYNNYCYYVLHVEHIGFQDLVIRPLAVAINVLLIISGLVLLYALYEIRRYLTGTSSALNSCQLLIHAISYGLFTAAQAFTFYLNLKPETDLGLPDEIAMTFSLISQVLMVYIMITLSTDNGQEDEDEEEQQYEDIAVETAFDDSDLYASIWNMFARVRVSANDEVAESRVISSRQIRLKASILANE
jgi:hypothetical protein